MIRGSAACVALALLLAACADGSSRWTKPGATGETISAELDACRDEARAATRRDEQIDADILASRGNDWQRSGALATKQDQMATQRSGYGRDIVERCMAAKGFRPAH